VTTVISTACRVYLDTSALKFSIDRIEGWTPVEETVNWGGREFSVRVHKPAVALPIENIKNEELKSEARLLRRIAELAQEGLIELLVQNETMVELWGLPRSGVGNTLFFGARITKVKAPFEYGRVVFSAFEDAEKLQYEFLCRIASERFVDLQKACGAYQGSEPLSPNQLRDAFQVWCAEGAAARFFLTCDLSLVRYVQRQKRYIPKVRVVTPSQLLAEIHDEE
jgi:hypothetical protein